MALQQQGAFQPKAARIDGPGHGRRRPAGSAPAGRQVALTFPSKTVGAWAVSVLY
jgi:hypothetical protein